MSTDDQTAPPVTIQVTEYRVSCLPASAPDADLFEITVSWRGTNKWAVKRHGRCLGRGGSWDWECRPTERLDDWLADHRFDHNEAQVLAVKAAPLVKVNGLLPADILRMEKEGTVADDPTVSDDLVAAQKNPPVGRDGIDESTSEEVLDV